MRYGGRDNIRTVAAVSTGWIDLRVALASTGVRSAVARPSSRCGQEVW